MQDTNGSLHFSSVIWFIILPSSSNKSSKLSYDLKWFCFFKHNLNCCVNKSCLRRKLKNLKNKFSDEFADSSSTSTKKYCRLEIGSQFPLKFTENWIYFHQEEKVVFSFLLHILHFWESLSKFFKGFSNWCLKVLIKLPFMIFLGISSQAIFLQRKFWTRPLADKYVNFQLVPAFRFCFFGTPSGGGNVKGGKCFKVGTCPQYCELLDFSQLCIKKSPLTP